jgi:hypothetical protein
MMIGGSNTFGEHEAPASYYFSRYANIWGWATWRRAWSYYDVNLRRWPELRQRELLLDIFGDAAEATHWCQRLDKSFAGHDSWDYAWSMSIWAQNGLSILPYRNLVTNIGFGNDATHTRPGREGKRVSVPLYGMKFPLRHPTDMLRDRSADRHTYLTISEDFR